MRDAVLVPVYLLLVTPVAFATWPAGSELLLDPRALCQRKRQGRRPQEICRERAVLHHVGGGVRLAQEECQWQFRHRRWNCTSAKRSIRHVVLNETRETGFVDALVAAGVTYAVTRACTTGELATCSCDGSRRTAQKKSHGRDGDWRWRGCGENVRYGVRKSKDFLDARYRHVKNDIKTLVKLHNYAAGRMAIRKHMQTHCKCHGMTGSCTMKTCWKKMPPFRDVGDRLKDHFDGAAKVIPGNDGRSFVPEGETIKPPGRADLVYLEESTNYCTENLTLGSLGTRGRSCDAASLGEEGCDILCCGRGHRVVRRREVVSCNCTFEYCCRVACQTCAREYDDTVCR